MSSPLMGEDEGEGDSWTGATTRQAGLPPGLPLTTPPGAARLRLQVKGGSSLHSVNELLNIYNSRSETGNKPLLAHPSISCYHFAIIEMSPNELERQTWHRFSFGN